MPECYNLVQLWKFLGCSNLTTTLQGCNKVVTSCCILCKVFTTLKGCCKSMVFSSL